MALVIVGCLCVLKSVSYAGRFWVGPGAHPAELWMPPSAWLGVWLVVGVFTIVCARWHDSPIAAVAVGLSVGLCTLWGCSLLAASVMDGNQTTFGRALPYFTISVLVWWAVWRGQRVPPDGEVGGV